jgi:hypothetical protein
MSDEIHHPISELGAFTGYTRDWLGEVRENAETLEQTRTKPYVLSDSDVARIKRVYTQQARDIGLFEQTSTRWRTHPHPTPAEQAGLDVLDEQLRQLRDLNTRVLAIVDVLESQTIESLMAMSDMELGLAALLRSQETPRP